MRIAHLESSLNWGGQELRIIEQTQWLNDNGHTAWILARPASAILREARKRNLPHLAIEFRGSANPKIICELIQFIRANKIDLIDAHSNRDAAYAMFAKWLTNVTVIRSRHVTTPIKNSFLHRLIWKTGNHGIVTTAKAVNQMIIDLGLAPASKLYTAKAGVDANRYNTSINSEDLRNQLGIPHDHHVITNIGMIRQDKGQLYFVKACELIAEQRDDVTFLQIGESTADTKDYEEEVIKYWQSSRFKDRIHFLGYHSDIERYQALSDIVMICSIGTEAQTRLVSQAFLIGNNVVSTNVGGLPEMIEHGRTGIICPPASPSELANACLELLESEDKRETLRENALHFAQQEMTFERMMEGMLFAYNQAMGRFPVGN